MKKLIFLLPVILFSCNKNNRTTTSDRTDYDKAYKYLNTSEKDSAFKYFNRAKDFFIRKDNHSFAGSCLVNMAIIQCYKGDYYGSQETALSAIKYLNIKKDTLEILGNYNNLGITCQNLKEYNNAAQFYNKAVNFSNDPIDKLTILNNKAVSYTYLKKYDSAIQIFNKILDFPNIKAHCKIFSKVNDNLAYAKFSQSPLYNAEPELNAALQIRKETKDNDGLNASFYHLTKYFENKDINKALHYAKENWQIAKVNDSPDDQLRALQNIITLENSNNIKYFFLKYQNLNDSLQTSRNKAKNQFALIRFDAEKMKNEIAENEVDLLKKNITLITLLILLIGSVFWYKRRKKRLKQEKELEVKNTQLKMSKKVHDVVANGLYHMMIDVQNNPEMDKTRILNNIEKMYEESRDISHENIAEKDFTLRFISMITSYSCDEQKVLLVGYKESIWENISYNTQLELYYILREILVNMRKHSRAKLASVKFEKDYNSLKIRYTDNGIGINDLNQRKGTGIHNTENRIESIGGDIIFEKNPTGGLIVRITIPIQSKYV